MVKLKLDDEKEKFVPIKLGDDIREAIREIINESLIQYTKIVSNPEDKDLSKYNLPEKYIEDIEVKGKSHSVYSMATKRIKNLIKNAAPAIIQVLSDKYGENEKFTSTIYLARKKSITIRFNSKNWVNVEFSNKIIADIFSLTQLTELNIKEGKKDIDVLIKGIISPKEMPYLLSSSYVLTLKDLINIRVRRYTYLEVRDSE